MNKIIAVGRPQSSLEKVVLTCGMAPTLPSHRQGDTSGQNASSGKI